MSCSCLIWCWLTTCVPKVCGRSIEPWQPMESWYFQHMDVTTTPTITLHQPRLVSGFLSNKGSRSSIKRGHWGFNQADLCLPAKLWPKQVVMCEFTYIKYGQPILLYWTSTPIIPSMCKPQSPCFGCHVVETFTQLTIALSKTMPCKTCGLCQWQNGPRRCLVWNKFQYRPKGFLGKKLSAITRMRQKCVSQICAKICLVLLGKEDVPKMRQKCAEHLWGRTPFGRYQKLSKQPSGSTKRQAETWSFSRADGRRLIDILMLTFGGEGAIDSAARTSAIVLLVREEVETKVRQRCFSTCYFKACVYQSIEDVPRIPQKTLPETPPILSIANRLL